MNEFFKFMATRWGRTARFCVGLILFMWGIGLAGWGYFLAAFGLLSMFTGATDICLLAPFFNLPITGKMLRKHYGITEPKLELE